jgi:hypothetical protein
MRQSGCAWSGLVLGIVSSGCVISQGPLEAKIWCLGEPPAQVIKAMVQRPGFLEPVAKRGVIVGFEGLVTNNLRLYAHDFGVLYGPHFTVFMGEDHRRFVPDRFWSSRQRSEVLTVWSFSNGNSVLGLGGRNGFLQRLEREKVKVDLLVLFEDTWGGPIPSNVRGVINICTKDCLSGRPVGPDRLGNSETWVVNVVLADLDHSRLPLFTDGERSAYEEFTRCLYTGLILAALDAAE